MKPINFAGTTAKPALQKQIDAMLVALLSNEEILVHLSLEPGLIKLILLYH